MWQRCTFIDLMCHMRSWKCRSLQRLALALTLMLWGWTFSGWVGAQSFESVLAPGKVVQGHAKLEEDCKQCHVKFDRNAQSGLCADCHKEVGVDLRAKTGYHGRLKPQACHDCHTEHKGLEAQIINFDKKKFDHNQSDFVLREKHLSLECEKCHVAGKKYREASTQCSVCHRKDDVHKGSLGAKCADCHNQTNWKEFKFDHGTTRFALTEKHVSVKCVECHKVGSSYKDAPRACVGCHKKDDDSAKGHKGLYGEKCESCHGVHLWKTLHFNHDTDTKYALQGKHSSTKCVECHTGKLYSTIKLSRECYTCHKKDDKHKESLGKDCASCHIEKNWKESPKFDHAKSKFPLLGKHIKTECKECHKSAMFKEAPKDCYSCHKKDDKHKENLGEKCADCHSEKEWKDTQGRFVHDKTKFALRNAHAKATVKCEACHKELSRFRKTPMECFSCHRKDDKHEGQEGTRCEKCHTDRDWKVPQFDHGLTRFPLLGKHAPLACAKCHTGARFKDAKIACVACHVKDDKHKKGLGPDCGQCHNARTWKDWKFDHDRLTKFALDGKHKTTACGLCHTRPTEDQVFATSSECYSCHAKDDIHQAGFGRRCQQCHVTSSFKSLKQKAVNPDGSISSTLRVLQEGTSVRPSQPLPRSPS